MWNSKFENGTNCPMTNTNSFQNWVETFAGWVCRLLGPPWVSAGGCEQAPGLPEGAESTDSLFIE